MTQKHHQEEISGPLDTIEAAQLLKDLPRPKRARIQSQKALENQAQNNQFEVLSLRAAIPSTSILKAVLQDLSLTGRDLISVTKLQQ
jgi:hypothetical protein